MDNLIIAKQGMHICSSNLTSALKFKQTLGNEIEVKLSDMYQNTKSNTKNEQSEYN